MSRKPSDMQRHGWIFHAIYGQRRTAESVADAIRKSGRWMTQIVTDKHDNHSVYKKARP